MVVVEEVEEEVELIEEIFCVEFVEPTAAELTSKVEGVVIVDSGDKVAETPVSVGFVVAAVD